MEKLTIAGIEFRSDSYLKWDGTCVYEAIPIIGNPVYCAEHFDDVGHFKVFCGEHTEHFPDDDDTFLMGVICDMSTGVVYTDKGLESVASNLEEWKQQAYRELECL